MANGAEWPMVTSLARAQLKGLEEALEALKLLREAQREALVHLRGGLHRPLTPQPTPRESKAPRQDYFASGSPRAAGGGSRSSTDAPKKAPGSPATAGRASGLVMFDFDQTLAAFHVYGSVCGHSDNKHARHLRVPQPFARTELGQLRRVAGYDAEEHFSTEGGFALAAFGGPERVRELSHCLEELKRREVQLIVCSNCYVAPMRKILADVGLLRFFDRIYGRLGEHHCDKLRENNPEDENAGNVALRQPVPFDVQQKGRALTPEEMEHMGKPEEGDWSSKIILLNSLKKDAGFQKHQVVLVEDDEKAISAASQIVATLFVDGLRGLTPEHCAKLLAMLDPSKASPSADNQTPKADSPEEKKKKRAAKKAAMDARLAKGLANR